jgi:hypothetical protein
VRLTCARCVAVAILAFPLLFAFSMDKKFSHDEHQHIAAGALFARESLLPYSDYPYFHTPHLVFVYGWLFRLSDHLVVTARSFSAFCGAVTAGVIFSAACSILRDWRFSRRIALAIAATVLLITTPVFIRATGNAWNQDPSILFAVLSVLLVIDAAPRSRTGLYLLVAGGCLGLSVGFRITFAPIALPLLCIVAFSPQFAARSRVRLLAWFSAGALVGLAPFFWLLAIAPEQTLFCNFGFPQSNIAFRYAMGAPRTMSIPTKLWYLVKEVMPKNLLLLLALFATLGFYWRNGRRRAEWFPLLSLAGVMPFVLAGSLAPSPSYQQYFYAPVPFLILAIIYASASLPEHPKDMVASGFILCCLVSLSAALAVPSYRSIKHLFGPADWRSMGERGKGQELKTRIGSGPVLTLAPTGPLEAGLEIYPPFATGPFAWRVAPFIEPGKRKRVGIVSYTELEQYLSKRPPRAILVGTGKKEPDEPFMIYAQQHGYQSFRFEREYVLWLSPDAATRQRTP